MAGARLYANALGILLLAATPAVLAVIGISATQNLQFGRFAAATGGTVAVSPNGTRTAGGGVILAGGSYAQAAFTVTGIATSNYSISLPANGAVALTGPGTNMAINNFVSSPSTSGTLDALGQQTLNVGATLTVNANQTNGNYSGSFDVIVNYQ